MTCWHSWQWWWGQRSNAFVLPHFWDELFHYGPRLIIIIKWGCNSCLVKYCSCKAHVYFACFLIDQCSIIVGKELWLPRSLSSVLFAVCFVVTPAVTSPCGHRDSVSLSPWTALWVLSLKFKLLPQKTILVTWLYWFFLSHFYCYSSILSS